MKGYLYIGGFFLPLSFLFLVAFPKNLPKTFRRYRSAFVWKILFHSFCTFEVMTHFVAEKGFLICILLTHLNITFEI